MPAAPFDINSAPPEGDAFNYIALFDIVFDMFMSFIVFMSFIAFMSVEFMVMFASIAFMSVIVLSVIMFSAARFSSTFIVLSADSLLLQAETAKAAPATRIRARIQNSLD